MIHRHHSKPGRRGPGLALGALMAIALGALAPAVADARPPRISERPVVAGTPVVGSTVEAAGAEWDGAPPLTATWQWLRCPEDSDDRDDCSSIAGATAIAYLVTEADLGSRLRVLLEVRNEDGSSRALSKESAAVTLAPEPTPWPSPSPSPRLPRRRSPRPRPRPSRRHRPHRRQTASRCSTRRPRDRRG